MVRKLIYFNCGMVGYMVTYCFGPKIKIKRPLRQLGVIPRLTIVSLKMSIRVNMRINF